MKIYMYIKIYIFLYIDIDTDIYTGNESVFSLFGKRKTNHNKRLLFQQTCSSMPFSFFLILACLPESSRFSFHGLGTLSMYM